MKKNLKTFLILLIFNLFFILTTQFIFGQNTKIETKTKVKEAIELMDKGQINEAIKLLEECQKLDPDNIDIPYEIAVAWYMKKDYKKSTKILVELTKNKKAHAQIYQLLGNNYDVSNERKKAIATYEKGLKLFPKSGPLYLEMGVVQMDEKEYNKALNIFEKGIKVDPKFPSNYYWACILYCSSTEKLYGIMYGEIFMNLERNSKRTAAISKILFDTYKKNIVINGDSTTVSFSNQYNIGINEKTDIKKIKIPYSMIYEANLMLSILNEKAIDLESLNRIRTKFIEAYFEKKLNAQYPNILYDFQNKALKSGVFEAYNHWTLMKGDEDAFNKWQSENKEKWSNFVEWFGENSMKIDENNFYHTSQY